MLPGMKLFDLTGRVAVVTGGSKGLGVAMAAGLASAGADLVLVSRREAEVTAAAQELATTYGRRVIGVPADVTSESDMQALARTASGNQMAFVSGFQQALEEWQQATAGAFGEAAGGVELPAQPFQGLQETFEQLSNALLSGMGAMAAPAEATSRAGTTGTRPPAAKKTPARKAAKTANRPATKAAKRATKQAATAKASRAPARKTAKKATKKAAKKTAAAPAKKAAKRAPRKAAAR